MGAVAAVTQPYGIELGKQFPFDGVSPATAANFSYTSDGLGLRRFLTLVFTLTTDGNAANRYVTVEYLGQASAAFAVGAAAVTVSASSTQRFVGQLGRGEGEWAANTDVLFSLPLPFLSPGNVLQIKVANIQAGDTLTGIRGVYELFPLDTSWLPEINS